MNKRTPEKVNDDKNANRCDYFRVVPSVLMINGTVWLGDGELPWQSALITRLLYILAPASSAYQRNCRKPYKLRLKTLKNMQMHQAALFCWTRRQMSHFRLTERIYKLPYILFTLLAIPPKTKWLLVQGLGDLHLREIPFSGKSKILISWKDTDINTYHDTYSWTFGIWSEFS